MYLGFDLWVQMSVCNQDTFLQTYRHDVPLTDEDNNSILTGQSKAMQVTQPGGQVSLNSIIPKNINFTSVEEMLKAAQVKNAAQQSNAIISQKRRRNAM